MNVKQFAELFRGLERAHGAYELTREQTRPGAKVAGRAVTLIEPVTEDHYCRHLAGKSGLGVVPIRDDSTCYFGAIDVDTYVGIDHAAVARAVRERGLPLIVCKSKSGGLHLFCFVSEPVPAKAMREKLTQFAAVLGHGGAEIFPKQVELLAARGDVGGWINLPYFGDTRRAVDVAGRELTLDEFIKAAIAARKTAAEFLAFTVELVGDLADGPPCLQYLSTAKFTQGMRNEGLFAIALYLKRARPETWRVALDEYNKRFFDPPLSSEEVASILKSVARKDYHYACDKPPFRQYCDRDLCRTRQYGVGPGAMFPVMTGLVKLDTRPPTWFITVEGGGRLELSTEDLQQQRRFQLRCMDALNIMPPLMKPEAWNALIQSLLKNVTIVEAPREASPAGQLVEMIESFCVGRAAARTQEELLLGKPWTNNGRHYFRLRDLMAYLERQRWRELRLHQITAVIREALHGEHVFFRIKGRGVNCWSVPEFPRQVESFSVPEIEDNSVI